MGRGVDRWFLIVATLLAAIGGVTGMVSLRHDHRSRWTFAWMAAAFAAQLGFLWLRGEARGACPLIGTGEILVFLAWSLTLFYLAVGPTYRISLLGVFSAPVVVVFQAVALIPGMLVAEPERVLSTDAWRETHAAMSVLGYGALALASVAGVMFLVLDRQLTLGKAPDLAFDLVTRPSRHAGEASGLHRDHGVEVLHAQLAQHDLLLEVAQLKFF